ncbi:MAG: cupin domain-containing protein [bacterium]|nr:cupin domain-containing protein [bacterium]
MSPLSRVPGLYPHVIDLSTRDGEYVEILGGRPQSAGMRAGLVTLRPGEAVGRHTTGGCEEVILVLEGQAGVELTGKASMRVQAPMAAYLPPYHEHDVVNTGSGLLRYIYVVAPVTEHT